MYAHMEKGSSLIVDHENYYAGLLMKSARFHKKKKKNNGTIMRRQADSVLNAVYEKKKNMRILFC